VKANYYSTLSSPREDFDFIYALKTYDNSDLRYTDRNNMQRDTNTALDTLESLQNRN